MRPQSAGEYVRMTIEFPANNGGKEGVLIPGLPGQLALDDKCLGFLCLY